MLAPARTLPVATTTSGGLLLGGSGVLFGWSWMETTATAGAQLALYDGQDTTGALITAITLLANESTRDLLAGEGLEIVQGLYLAVVSGSITGAVWVVTLETEREENVLTAERDTWDRSHL